ncbi:hypothetical protein ACSXEP_07240 [Clostridium perfringens]
MTAEIGILNRQGVALAADSAVTVGVAGKQKVLNSANKLFNLVKGLPVGLMVYGGGDFLGTPWDVVVNEFRKNFKEKDGYKNLEDYSESFIKALNSKKYFSKSSYERYVFNLISSIIEDVTLTTKGILSERHPNVELSPDKVLNYFNLCLIEKIRELNALEFLERFGQEDVEKIINDGINLEISKIILGGLFEFSLKEIEDIIGETQLNSIINSMVKISALAQTKDIFFNYTGIVVAGFGNDELFPVLSEYYVEGIINGKLKYKLNTVSKIYSTHTSENKTSEIIPFAQQEMVYSVLNGIDPRLENLIFSNIQHIMNRTLNLVETTFNCEDCEKKSKNINLIRTKMQNELNALMTYIYTDQERNYKDPIYQMVDLLPKDELATMAETLVNLTSFKRKITMDAETVGGPIDVAVISKSEGFIWIKRKHYFNKDLNSNYFK